jgi:hypothetical protein
MSESQIAALEQEVEHWKRKEREARDKQHTWRLLYQDLLEKIAKHLDLNGDK